MIRHREQEPYVSPTAFVAPTSVLAGAVRIGARARIMYGAVLDSEGSRVEVGETTVICENAVLRASAVAEREQPVIVRDHVFIGPHATLLGCTAEPSCYVATGATILHGAVIGSGAAVGVGALVHANTMVPEGFLVPPNVIAAGDPVELYDLMATEAAAGAIKATRFAESAFGVQARWEDRVARYTETTRVRAEEFESHFGDLILDETGDRRVDPPAPD